MKKEDKHKEHEKKDEQEKPAEQKADKFSDVSPEAKEYFEQLLRVKADFENYRKRIEKEKPALISFGKSQTYTKFLSLYDVVLHAKDELKKVFQDKNSSCDNRLSQMSKGIDMVFGEFEKLFKSEGIEVIDSLGKDFDPMAHEVLTVVECDENSDGKVVKEIQRGFIYGTTILRPSKVCVGKKKSENKSQGEDKNKEKKNQESNETKEKP